MPRALVWLAVVGALACAHVPETPPADPLADLHRLELERSLGAGRVLELSRDPDPDVRAHAFAVIARLQRVETVDAVVAGLSDPSAEVRPVAAFAAGQLGLSWQPLPVASLDRLATAVGSALASAPACEPHPGPCTERVGLARALGKLGRPAGVAPLELLLADPSPELVREAGIALGRIAQTTKGQAPGIEAIEPLGSIVIHGQAEARYGAAYALMRSKRPEARAALTFGLKDADPAVRAICARGLADVAEGTELPYLLERLGDPDEGVRVEAARALGKLASHCPPTGACPAAAAVASALGVLVKAYLPDHPETGMALLALAQEKLPAADAAPLEKAIAAFATGESHDRRVIGCWLAAALDHLSATGATPALDACAPGADLLGWEAGLRARTLAESVAPAALRATALLHLDRVNPQVAGAVDDGLGDLAVDLPEVRARVLFDLTSPDYTIALSAADAAGKLKLADAAPLLKRVLTLADANAQDDGMATVFTHLAGLKAAGAAAILLRYADDPRPTVRAGALAALEMLKATPTPIPEPRPRGLPSSEAGALDHPYLVRIHTSRGEIVARVDGGSGTAGNFAQLARRGFFDGLLWHRVVPDFVVQGGDPRGDGSGGPGFTIPCEINDAHYERGTLGMALSGKDTGGSQFFITLSAQPHLEGKYAIFGHVEQGMEVADRLVEGDRIEAIDVE